MFEALAVGVVPLVADFGGPGDIVHPGVGFKVTLTNESDVVSQMEEVLTKLTHNRALLDRLRERGHVLRKGTVNVGGEGTNRYSNHSVGDGAGSQAGSAASKAASCQQMILSYLKISRAIRKDSQGFPDGLSRIRIMGLDLSGWPQCTVPVRFVGGLGAPVGEVLPVLSGCGYVYGSYFIVQLFGLAQTKSSPWPNPLPL